MVLPDKECNKTGTFWKLIPSYGAEEIITSLGLLNQNVWLGTANSHLALAPEGKLKKLKGRRLM